MGSSSPSLACIILRTWAGLIHSFIQRMIWVVRITCRWGRIGSQWSNCDVLFVQQSNCDVLWDFSEDVCVVKSSNFVTITLKTHSDLMSIHVWLNAFKLPAWGECQRPQHFACIEPCSLRCCKATKAASVKSFSFPLHHTWNYEDFNVSAIRRHGFGSLLT